MSSYKVYSTASAQVEEQKKCLLNMLRGALTQPPPRTQALAHGKHKHGPAACAARNTFQPSHCSSNRAALLRHGLCPKAGQAGRRLPSELALAAGMGRD